MWSTCCSCQIVIKLECSWQIFEKSSNIKFHENPHSGSHVVPWEQTGIIKLIVTFHNSAYAPKSVCCGKGMQELWDSITYQKKLVHGTTGKQGKETPETVFPQETYQRIWRLDMITSCLRNKTWNPQSKFHQMTKHNQSASERKQIDYG
jgi:hypothetical protein